MSNRQPGRVSFIIPTRNNARTISACVASAVAQPGDVEVLVIDNHSTDGTADLARAARADLVIIAGPERSSQRNTGFDHATGEIVAFIDSDMELDPGLADALRVCFTDADVAAAVLPERSHGTGYLAASRALEKRLAIGDPRVEAARAFRASILDEVGPYDETIAAFEDYELADRVATRGGMVRAPVGVAHDEGRIRLAALARKKRYYGSQWWAARSRLAPHRLAGRSVPLEVLRHDLLHVPGLVVLKMVDGLSLAAGAAQAGREARRAERHGPSSVPTS